MGGRRAGRVFFSMGQARMDRGFAADRASIFSFFKNNSKKP
jgi:hypothetical protein